MGSFNSKFQEDDNRLRIEDLPVEIMCQIFGYFDTNEKMKIAMVNKRWLRIAIMDIKSIAIKWPQERNEDFINFIMTQGCYKKTLEVFSWSITTIPAHV